MKTVEVIRLEMFFFHVSVGYMIVISFPHNSLYYKWNLSIHRMSVPEPATDSKSVDTGGPHLKGFKNEKAHATMVFSTFMQPSSSVSQSLELS